MTLKKTKVEKLGREFMSVFLTPFTAFMAMPTKLCGMESSRTGLFLFIKTYIHINIPKHKEIRDKILSIQKKLSLYSFMIGKEGMLSLYSQHHCYESHKYKLNDRS